MIGADGGAVRCGVEAGVELREVYVGVSSGSGKFLLGVKEDLVVARIDCLAHWPELALVGGAFTGFGKPQRAISKLDEMAIDQFHSSRLDILLDQLWLSLQHVECTGRSEKIRKHFQGHWGLRIAKHMIALGGTTFGDGGRWGDGGGWWHR